MAIDTVYAKSEILAQKSAEDLLDYIKNNDEIFINWKKYILHCMEILGLTYAKLASMTGFSKNTIKSWCTEGIMPKNRDMFIKLAFGLNLDIEHTNELLTKYGKYSELYAKDLYDAIVIYVLNKRRSNPENPMYQYEALGYWFDKFKDIRATRLVDGKLNLQTMTVGVYNSIIGIEQDADFEKYIYDNKDIFFSTYSELVEFIDEFIRIRKSELEDVNDDNPENKYSWHRIAKEKNLDQSFEKMLSELRNHGIVPKREKLIALGIHLNMVSSDINNMLSLAHMKELYARDKVESLLLYILRNAVLTDPDLELGKAMKYYYGATSRRFKKEYDETIKKYQEQEDAAEWGDDYIEDLAEYIRNQLTDLNLEEVIDKML